MSSQSFLSACVRSFIVCAFIHSSHVSGRYYFVSIYCWSGGVYSEQYRMAACGCFCTRSQHVSGVASRYTGKSRYPTRGADKPTNGSERKTCTDWSAQLVVPSEHHVVCACVTCIMNECYLRRLCRLLFCSQWRCLCVVFWQVIDYW